MAERYCDVLIVGTDLTGLISAAFLARRGLHVQVLDIDPFKGVTYKPDPYPIAHLQSKLLRSILGRLNVPETQIQAFIPSESPLQIIFPDKRIEIASNPARFYEEIDREFPSHSESLKKFYENLTHLKHEIEVQHLYDLFLPHTFMERRQLTKFVKLHHLDKRLTDIAGDISKNTNVRCFIEAQLRLLLQTTKHRGEFAFNVAELLNPNEGETLFVHGGQRKLKEILLERIRHHDGIIRQESHLEALLYKNGIFEGVKIAGADGRILSRYTLWNMELRRLTEYLPKQFRFRKIRKAMKALTPSAHWFTAFYSVPKRFIPAPMQNNILMIDNPAKELTGTNFLFLQLRANEDADQVIAVNYLMEPKYLGADNESFTPIHDKIARVLNFLLPFSEDKLELVFPTVSTQQKATLFPLGENDFEVFKNAASRHAMFENKSRTFADLFPMSFRTASPNFFVTSQEILGGMGYESKYMLGLQVTDLIWKDVEKEKKHAMKVERRIA